MSLVYRNSSNITVVIEHSPSWSYFAVNFKNCQRFRKSNLFFVNLRGLFNYDREKNKIRVH